MRKEERVLKSRGATAEPAGPGEKRTALSASLQHFQGWKMIDVPESRLLKINKGVTEAGIGGS